MNIRDRLSKREEVPSLIHKQLGYIREEVSPNLFRVTIPTLPYQSLETGGGKVLPWHLMTIFNSGAAERDLATFKNGPHPIPNFYSYIMTFELMVESSFYDPNTPKFPIVMDFEYLYVKRSSRYGRGILKHPSRKEPYCKAEVIDVRVDPATRKSLPFPELWKDMFGAPSEGPRKEHIIPERTETTKVLVTEHKVAFSDTDYNGHANGAFFVRIAYNSFAENLFAGHLQAEAESHFENGLKKFLITFMKECLMGDVVNVESWTDQTEKDTYYFDLKRGGDLCARITFVFHKQTGSTLHKL